MLPTNGCARSVGEQCVANRPNKTEQGSTGENTPSICVSLLSYHMKYFCVYISGYVMLMYLLSLQLK